jgi:release factor glutamine methyltransferase
VKVREALADAARRLAAMSWTARLDAELLMAHVLDVERDALLLADQERPAPDAFEPLVRRRLAHEPVAYITGWRDFWTIRLGVGPGVLVPRPDSETLIEAAVDHFGAGGPAAVLDLGTGPGTLLLAALAQWPKTQGLGVDASLEALEYAERNADILGFEDRVIFRLGNWTEGLEGRFDLILCNPPYIEAEAALPPDVVNWEPAAALYAGSDGLDAYRRLAPLIGPRLAPGGIACIEIGAGQAAAVSALFAAEGFTIESRADLSGIERALILSA